MTFYRSIHGLLPSGNNNQKAVPDKDSGADESLKKSIGQIYHRSLF